ncbi:MAG: Gfo/Idh/MocA family oxidoreductase [Anaerolineales bacterium]|nr:Gfo/Idh/MocA family oxidoreductase [Anaerolineales bacterium]
MKFGLIGCGGIGELRAAALSQMPQHRLVAVNDLDPARAAALAAHTGATAVSNWQELVARDDLDVVVVSTPPQLHAEMSIAALAAGKHVLCEKPLARSVAECAQMVAAAEANGRFLATGFNYRFYPSMLKARELFDAGLIGELDHIRSYTGYSATAHDQAWLHDAAIMGGGALRDNGIHLIDLTCYFLGDVAAVQGMAGNAVWQFPGCEDNGFALIRSRAGKIASLQASWTEWRGYRLSVELVGSRGMIRATCFPMSVQATWADARGGKTQRKVEVFPRDQVMEKVKSYRWAVTESFVKEFDALETAVLGLPSPIATGQDGLTAIHVAETAAAEINN